MANDPDRTSRASRSVPAVEGTIDINALDDLELPDVDENGPGLALAVAIDGELAWTAATGVARAASGHSLDTGTSVYVASIAKQFTAACIALLIDDGRLTEDTAVRECLPELPAGYDGVVLTDLVHHISGVPSLEDETRTQGSRWWAGLGTWDMVELIARAGGPADRPGTAYRYANEGYLLLAAVVERVAGSSMNGFATERLFAPLGMSRSWFRDEPNAPHPDAAGHSPVDGSLQVDRTPFHFVGDGGLVTTVDDLVKWSTVHAPSHGLGGRLMERLTRHGHLRNGSELHYAWGLSVRPHRGRTIHSHGGQFVGNLAKVVQLPGDPTATFICLANRDDLDIDTLVMHAVDAVMASSFEPGAPDWRTTLRPDGLALPVPPG